jgi:hypothetical protein
LGPRIVRVRVVVENILRAHPPDGDGDSRNILSSRQVQFIISDHLLFATEADGLPEKDAGEIDIRRCGSEPKGFTIGKPGHAQRVADSESLPHQTVHMEFGAGPQAQTESQIHGHGLAGLTASRQAVRPGIFRGKCRIPLDDVRVLNVQIPVLLRWIGLLVHRAGIARDGRIAGAAESTTGEHKAGERQDRATKLSLENGHRKVNEAAKFDRENGVR